jgi:hypothetical protein
MQEVYWPHVSKERDAQYVGDSVGLEHLIGAYWGYDDLRIEPKVLLPEVGVRMAENDSLCQKWGYRGRNG